MTNGITGQHTTLFMISCLQEDFICLAYKYVGKRNSETMFCVFTRMSKFKKIGKKTVDSNKISHDQRNISKLIKCKNFALDF